MPPTKQSQDVKVVEKSTGSKGAQPARITKETRRNRWSRRNTKHTQGVSETGTGRAQTDNRNQLVA